MSTNTKERPARAGQEIKRPEGSRPEQGKKEEKKPGPVQQRLDKLKEAVELEKLANEAKSTTWRLRRQLVPHVVTGSVLGAGLAEHAIVASGSSVPRVMLLSVIASLGAGFEARRRVKKHRPRWTKRVTVAILVASGWLSLAPATGVTPASAAALVAAELSVAAGYWRGCRIGYPTREQKVIIERAREVREARKENPCKEPPAPAAPALGLAQQTISDWKKFVGNNGGPVPESVIANPVETRYTIAYDGLLSRGKQSFSTLLMNAPRIASGLDTTVENLIFETTFDDMKDHDESEGSTASEARFRFQLVTNSPIRGAVDFDGPRRKGGIIDLGPYADGSGEAPYRLYTPGSMWSGVVIGGTGSGKSRLLENAVISAISGGDTVIIYIDPQRGTSSPVLANNAHWFGTLDDAEMILEALLAAMGVREEENAAEGWTGFNPTPQRPGILTVIDESHRVFEQDGTRWSWVAREGRKLGFALLAADQYPGLKTFGNEEPLRSSVMEGNSFVLRSTSRQTGQLMPGLMVDPLSLPKIPGYAYVNGSEENGARTAPFRNRNTRPMHMGDEEALNWLTEWFRKQPMPDLDTLVKTGIKYSVAAEAYESRAKSETDRKERSMARVEALRQGLNPDEAVPGTRPLAKLARKVARLSGFEGAEVVKFPGAISAEVVCGDEAYDPSATVTRPALTRSQIDVLSAIAEGASRPAEIQEAVKLSQRQVQNLLKELVDRGELHQPRYGHYARTA